MYVHLGNLGIHDQWSVLLSDPSAKKKTSLFFGKIPIASGGDQFQQKQTMPPSYQYDLYPASLSVCALFTTS